MRGREQFSDHKKIFLFDLDGTLTDPAIGIIACTRFALEELNRRCPKDESLIAFIGPPLREMFSNLLNSSDKVLIEDAVRLYRERYSAIGIYEAQLYSGIPGMLERASRAAAAMFVVTSKATVFAERAVATFEIAHHFRRVYGAELDGRFDNKADLLRHMLALERIDPANAVMIGDRAGDIFGASANGIPGIGVLWGYGSERELRHAGARALYDTPDALADGLSRNLAL